MKSREFYKKETGLEPLMKHDNLIIKNIQN